MTGLMCGALACKRMRAEGSAYCPHHLTLWHARQRVDADYEAARIDPTTDRDRWDVWDDGGLERPGEDEL